MLTLVLRNSLIITFMKEDSFRTIPPGQLSPGQLTRGQLPQGQWFPGQLPPRTIALGQFPPRTITFRIFTHGQLLPRAMTITNYNFFMAIFCFFFFLPNYIISVFCYDNKNNNDNSNKTCSLKLLSLIIL